MLAGVGFLLADLFGFGGARRQSVLGRAVEVSSGRHVEEDCLFGLGLV